MAIASLNCGARKTKSIIFEWAFPMRYTKKAQKGYKGELIKFLEKLAFSLQATLAFSNFKELSFQELSTQTLVES